MGMWLCVRLYMYVYVCIRLHMYVCIHLYMYVNVCIRLYMYVNVCIRLYMYVYVYPFFSINIFFVYMYKYFHTFKCLRRGFLTTRTAHPSIPNSTLTARIHQQTSFLNRRGWGTEKFIKGSQRMLRESLESSSSETAALVGSSGTLLVARLLAYSCVTFCWD